MGTKSLNILCFGDSLTSGYHDMGLSSNPYSNALTARLQAALPDTAVHVFTNGVPGDVASFPAFHRRLQRECENHNYDWVIILGGTNDIGYHVSPEHMYRGFKSNWQVPLSKGSKVLALTVPESQARPDWVVNARNSLNDLILRHEEPNFYTFDLHGKIPYHALSATDREKYWDDGLHLTADGYDWMGDHIATGLLSILNESNATKPQRTDDNTVFEEEGGHPQRLSQGYVVVRKRDLW